jgi:hypothetical protein
MGTNLVCFAFQKKYVILKAETSHAHTMKSEFDYDPKKDEPPKKVMIWIIVAAFLAALYLSQILV